VRLWHIATFSFVHHRSQLILASLLTYVTSCKQNIAAGAVRWLQSSSMSWVLSLRDCRWFGYLAGRHTVLTLVMTRLGRWSVAVTSHCHATDCCRPLSVKSPMIESSGWCGLTLTYDTFLAISFDIFSQPTSPSLCQTVCGDRTMDRCVVPTDVWMLSNDDVMTDALCFA